MSDTVDAFAFHKLVVDCERFAIHGSQLAPLNGLLTMQTAQ